MVMSHSISINESAVFKTSNILCSIFEGLSNYKIINVDNIFHVCKFENDRGVFPLSNFYISQYTVLILEARKIFKIFLKKIQEI